MISESAPEGFPQQEARSDRHYFGWGSALVACFVLLYVIQYCPTYAANKAPLFMLWRDTFWHDLTTQISSLFAAKSKNTLSGEVTANEFVYCGAVPFIVAWLLWELWPALRKMPTKGSPHGYAILAAGFLLYIAGYLMENYYVGMGAMELVYAGLIVLFFGWAIMRALIFPWAFLMFMWPYNFMEDVALELRLLMSSMSHHVLQIIGVENVLKGTAIMAVPGAAQSFGIDIADPCSGIRSLFALVMIAAVYAFMAFDKLWQQVIIVALAVPLVILGNLVRIVLLVMASLHFGEAFAVGNDQEPSWFHETAGYLVYLINFGGLILVGSLLARLTPKPKKDARA